MKKKVVLCFCLIFFGFAFMGCGKKILEGEVYEKEFRPEKSILIMIPVVISNGKTTTTVLIPTWHHYPDRWVLKIKNYDAKKDKEVTEQFFVTKEVFDSIDIGDWVVFDSETFSFEEPVIQEREKNY